MCETVDVGRADDRHVIDLTRQMREQVGDFDPRFAVLGELPRAAEQIAGRAHGEQLAVWDASLLDRLELKN